MPENAELGPEPRETGAELSGYWIDRIEAAMRSLPGDLAEANEIKELPGKLDEKRRPDEDLKEKQRRKREFADRVIKKFRDIEEWVMELGNYFSGSYVGGAVDEDRAMGFLIEAAELKGMILSEIDNWNPRTYSPWDPEHKKAREQAALKRQYDLRKKPLETIEEIYLHQLHQLPRDKERID